MGERRLDRREFLQDIRDILIATALSPLIINCTTEQAKDTVEIEWLSLSAIGKINRLEFKKYPKNPNFDFRLELVSAVADLYCQRVMCKKSSAELKNNVLFVDRKFLLDEAEKDSIKRGGRGFTLEERKQQEYVRAISTIDGKILIGYEQIMEDAKNYLREDPKIETAIQGADLATVILKSVMIHEFSHANQSGQSVEIPFRLSGGEIIERIEGFEFFGKKADGTTKIFLTGASEAMTEYVTLVIATKDNGNYSGIHETYTNGAFLIRDINRRAGISNNEFIDYYTGEKATTEFLMKWGAIKNPSRPDIAAGLFALFTIGLYVDGSIKTTQDAQKTINFYLNP